MGVEMKCESDFKLRCMRVKKKVVGILIGLGSVVSMGLGMSFFLIMNNVLVSKVRVFFIVSE